ncbi:MAG: SpoIIE family protein phosphatase [Candidatus Competibacteraceae bacterium]
MMDGMPFKQDTVTLAAGDRLLLYTDGVTEGSIGVKRSTVLNVWKKRCASALGYRPADQDRDCDVIDFAGQNLNSTTLRLWRWPTVLLERVRPHEQATRHGAITELAELERVSPTINGFA